VASGRVATIATVASVEVPDAFGETLARAKLVMGAAGLRGAADDRDPQVPGRRPRASPTAVFACSRTRATPA
jgi:hypothetical protein